MRKFSVYQTVYLGSIEVPDEALGKPGSLGDCMDVIEYMNERDCWPEDFLEPISTDIEEETP